MASKPHYLWGCVLRLNGVPLHWVTQFPSILASMAHIGFAVTYLSIGLLFCPLPTQLVIGFQFCFSMQRNFIWQTNSPRFEGVRWSVILLLHQVLGLVSQPRWCCSYTSAFFITSNSPTPIQLCFFKTFISLVNPQPSPLQHGSL